MIPRLYVPAMPAAVEAVIPVDNGQHHYLRNVLRLGEAATVLLFNAEVGEWRGEVIAAKKSTAIKLLEQTKPALVAGGSTISLWFAPIKRDAGQFLVQKATELGVHALQPVITARTVATRVKVDRLQANAMEAAEQTERLDVPVVSAPQSLSVIMSTLAANDKLLFCDEQLGRADDSNDIISVLQQQPRDDANWILLIGPEGGFTVEEHQQLQALPQCVSVSLGPRLLRADTAALAALACWQGILGDWKS